MSPATLSTFRSFDTVTLHYAEYGAGDPLVLLHAFMIDSAINWVDTDLVQDLVGHGYRVITLDARGHGQSEKPHQAEAYGNRAMARDVEALLAHLHIEEAVVCGYSMGGYTAIEAALLSPRIVRVIAGGVGQEAIPLDEHRALAEDLRAADPHDPSYYRDFADEVGGDRDAFAAWIAGMIYPQVTRADLARLTVPTLIINGADEPRSGSAVAAEIPKGTGVTVPGDHLSAIYEPAFLGAILSFLK